MNEVAFVEKKDPDWRRLAYLSDKAEVSPRQLSPNEFQEFVRLYRRAAADLALVRTKSTNIQLIEFLNDLVGRAYSTLYQSRRKPFFKAIFEWFATAAQTGRKLKWFILASLLTFLGSVAVGYIASAKDPAVADLLVPEGYKSSFEGWTSGSFEPRDLGQSSESTAFYSANNVSAGIQLAGASTASFGIWGAKALWQNGSILGVLAFKTYEVGKLGHLLIWIAPHGASEITGFVVAGGAGYALAWSLISPGRRKRTAALKEAGKDAITLLVMSCIMIAAAAPVEGFFSFNATIPDWVKVIFAVFALSVWIGFYTGFGRPVSEE